MGGGLLKLQRYDIEKLCFPKELQEAIASTQITYNSHTGTSVSSHQEATCYDKLFLLSVTDVYGSDTISYDQDTTQYSRNSSLNITSSNYSLAVEYDESTSATYAWLRSVYYKDNYFASYTCWTKSYSNNYVYETYGISPCFSLK